MDGKGWGYFTWGMCKKDSKLEGRKEQTLTCPGEENFRQERSAWKDLRLLGREI